MTMPETSTMPMELRAAAPGPLARMSGKCPATVATEVIKIGRSRVPAASTAGPRTNPGTTPRTGKGRQVGPAPPTGARRGRPVGAARLTPAPVRRGRADRCPGLQVVVDPQRPQIATGRHAGFPGAATSGLPVVRSSGPPVAPRSGLAVDSLPTAGRAPGGNLLRSATRRSPRRSPPMISIGLFGPSCPACPRHCRTSSAGTSSWPDV